MISKRSLLRTGVAALANGAFTCGTGAAQAMQNRLALEGVTATWRHDNGEFIMELAAPTPGWLAIGFNGARELRGTRFFMAVVSAAPVRAEEHVALVPEHRTVAAAGLSATKFTCDGAYAEGVSTLRLRLPLAIVGRPDLRFRHGDRTHLMLAWSRETDFQHHSAWRRHFDIIL